MASNKVEMIVKFEEASYNEALRQLEELNRQAYVLSKLFRRSWLLRLLFGVDLKKLELEITDEI
jgi:hypothetical protein